VILGLRRETWRERVRRRWRSLTRYTGLRFWMLSRGMLMLVTVGILYVAGGLVIGWQTAYEIAVGITSPDSVASPPAALPTSPAPSAAVVVLAWALSLTGWLVVPGIAGAVAGYVVTAHADQRRDRPLDSFLPPTSSGEGTDA
jgi:hypothetical protein